MIPPQRPGNFPFQQMNRHGFNYFMMPNQSMGHMAGQMPQRNVRSFIQRILQPGSNHTMGSNVFSNAVSNNVGGTTGGLAKTLNNVQQILKVVETTAPYIQQYGPMVRNLPAMIQMIKAFQNTESTELTESEESISIDVSENLKSEESISVDVSENLKSEEILHQMESRRLESDGQNKKSNQSFKQGNKYKNGDSIPKLYI